MNKPPDFWANVAKDVNVAARTFNDQVPAWDELDDLGKKTLELICQLAVKSAARRGKFLLEDPVVT
jgi:hypothetical protein